MRSPSHISAMIGLAALASLSGGNDYELRDEPQPRRDPDPARYRQIAKVQTKTGNRERARRLRQQAAIAAKRKAEATTHDD